MNAFRIALIFFIFPLGTLSSQNRHKDSLIVFVATGIEVNYYPNVRQDTLIAEEDTTLINDTLDTFDARYLAKCKILQMVHGDFSSDSITFWVYSHKGAPAFQKFENVLLYVNHYNGELIHEKYLFHDVYMTESGRWASPFSFKDTDRYFHHIWGSHLWDFYKDSSLVEPEKMTFRSGVAFPVGNLSKLDIWRDYPEPFFKIENGLAYPLYGNYVEDILKLMEYSILKWRWEEYDKWR